MANHLPTSSPLSSAQSSQSTFQTATSLDTPAKHNVQSLPFELLSHVHIYFEENLITQALRLLLSLVTSSAVNEFSPTPLPPPDYLATISTFTVHPDFTTRATTQDRLLQSNLALQLLQSIAKIAGPVHANLIEAFRFRKFDTGKVETDEDDEGDWNTPKLSLKYACNAADNIFTAKDDFWAVVGWALNCACRPGIYAARWAFWKPWLEYMLGILEAEWEMKNRDGKCGESLIWEYACNATGGNARARRILRAVFADGSSTSLKEFTEVFPKELKEPRNDKNKTKKQEVAVDFEQEVYGDWLQESETSTENEEDAMRDVEGLASKRTSTRTPSTRRHKTPRANKMTVIKDNEDSEASGREDSTYEKTLGNPETLAIRLRLLQLLSNISANLNLTDSSTAPFPDTHELYTLFVEFVKPLPLQLFALVVLPSSMSADLLPEARMMLCEFILQRIIENKGPSTKRSILAPMTQQRLIDEYLPYGATDKSIDAQARVSLLLESILRLLSKAPTVLKRGSDLMNAVDTGLASREMKATDARNNAKMKKGVDPGAEEMAMQMLTDSGTRLVVVIDMLRDPS